MDGCTGFWCRDCKYSVHRMFPNHKIVDMDTLTRLCIEQQNSAAAAAAAKRERREKIKQIIGKIFMVINTFHSFN